MIQEFKERRTRQLMASAVVVLGIVGMIWLDKNPGAASEMDVSSAVIGPVFVGMVLVVLAFSFYSWRCPGCNKYLGKAITPNFCQKCGAPLQ
jgi:hypothetical protein